MNFGYLLIVSEHESIDYMKMAYALALSIKLTQKPGYNQIALVVNDKNIADVYNVSRLFDHVIEWDQETFWNGRSWMDKLTPFDHTICLDVDMLFTEDISTAVDYFLENCELYIPSRVYTYRNELIIDEYYRKTFIKNDLPNLYSMMTFFKKESRMVQEFFELGRHIIKNPKEFSNVFLSEYIPKIVGTDEAFALSAKILDIYDTISYDLDFIKLIHMKPLLQKWKLSPDKFNRLVNMYVNRNFNIKIGNYSQQGIIHYVEKDLIDLEIISLIEERLWNTQ